MKELVIVTGARDSGKTTLLNAYCSYLVSKGFRLGGIVCTAPLPGQEKTDWIANNLATGESRLLMSLASHPGWEKKGRFHINTSVFSWANSGIVASFTATDYLVFDEIGKFEIDGYGYSSAFSEALRTYPGSIIAVIRDTLLNQVANAFSINLGQVRFLQAGIPPDRQGL
ncbi:MAG: nucleoside-triphosphatase [Sphaerochaetaceae bacterium]